MNNKCQAFTAPSTCTKQDCVQCNSTTGACTQCASGFVLSNGYCVCGFQNCLECQGSAFCKVCAFPTIQTYASSAGCLPEISIATICDVTNCQSCKAPNQCSECFGGYTLQSDGSCMKNNCPKESNCMECST